MEQEAPTGHVVHLVRLFSATAPEAIGFGTRLRPGGRTVLWGIILVGAIGTAILLVNLWTSDSPWWFNLIFTAMPSFFLVGCAIALLESARLSRIEERLATHWAQNRGRATVVGGRVTDREVALMEHGGVSSIVLAATDAAGTIVRARWYRSSPAHRDATLLQTQVPAIGAEVRIWTVGGAAEAELLILEALDPSVVP